MTEKKKKKAKLHVVNDEAQDVERDWSVKELTSKLKKARKKIKALESQLEIVINSNGILKEEHATLTKRIDTMDTRTQRMGIVLRECMKKLDIPKPEW